MPCSVSVGDGIITVSGTLDDLADAEEVMRVAKPLLQRGQRISIDLAGVSVVHYPAGEALLELMGVSSEGACAVSLQNASRHTGLLEWWTIARPMYVVRHESPLEHLWA